VKDASKVKPFWKGQLLGDDVDDEDEDDYAWKNRA
jgi:hypothetical protein